MVGGGAWCPARVISNQSREWMEVDLGREQMVTGVITQGRWDRGLGQEFAQHVMIQYWGEEGEWQSKGGWRKGNIDTFTPVVIQLRIPVRTNRVRIVPVSHHPRTVCIRMEVCGCGGDGGEVRDESDGGEVRGESDGGEVHDERDGGEVHDESDCTLDDSDNILDVMKDTETISTSFMSLLIGMLVTIIIILSTALVFILYKNYTTTQKHSTSVPKSEDSYQVYHSLPPDSTSHYTDSSTEYSSPLLDPLLPQHKVDWNTFFPPPPPPPQPTAYQPVHPQAPTHYAQSGIIWDRGSNIKAGGHCL